MSFTDSVANTLAMVNTQNHSKTKAEEVIGMVKGELEVLGAAAAIGYANGRSPAAGLDHAQIAGAPIDLGTFVAANAAIVLGFGGKYAEDLAAVGAGAGAVYMTRLFTRYGSQARVEAQTGATPKQIASGGFMGGAPIGRRTQVGYKMAG